MEVTKDSFTSIYHWNRLLWHTSNQVHHTASEVSVGLDADTNSDKGVVVVHCEADADEGVVDDEADADAGFDSDESDFFFNAKKDGLLLLHSTTFEQSSLNFVQFLK